VADLELGGAIGAHYRLWRSDCAWNSAGDSVRSASSIVKNYDIAPPATGLIVDMAL
jgi:hypothetical protein